MIEKMSSSIKLMTNDTFLELACLIWNLGALSINARQKGLFWFDSFTSQLTPLVPVRL